MCCTFLYILCKIRKEKMMQQIYTGSFICMGFKQLNCSKKKKYVSIFQNNFVKKVCFQATMIIKISEDNFLTLRLSFRMIRFMSIQLQNFNILSEI
jgi:hypothetical protein